jgi:autotransporter-associated beta strand protein
MKRLSFTAIRCSLMFLIPTVTYAISAQWDLDPISGDWNTAANWTPMGVPNGPADVATFGLSNTMDVSISEDTEVNGITFTAAATNSYTITASPGPGVRLTISGTGIINTSGATQNFVTGMDGAGNRGIIVFTASATAGSATLFTNDDGGVTLFLGNSTAGNGTFINNAGAVLGGLTDFAGHSTAGSGTFINNGGAERGRADTEFEENSTAGSSTVINNGGTVEGAFGGRTFLLSSAGSATLIANGGTNGGRGGQIIFEGISTGGTSRIEVFGNGSLDISLHGAPGITIGSVEGDGNVFLGAQTLSVGSNNLNTTFSGVIQDGGIFGGVGGSLTKIGAGTLTLSGANTYTGDTNVNRGVLQADGSITSNTFVNHGGTLAGTGTINGNVTNNGKVSPGALGAPGVLTVVHNYTQAEFATLMIQIAGMNTGDFSVLNVLGNANLNGVLDPVLLNGFVPSIGDSFIFLNYASLTGEFSRILHPIFNNGTEQWSVIYEANNAILTVEQHVPDQGSTFLLLTLGLLGLVTFRRQLLRRQL